MFFTSPLLIRLAKRSSTYDVLFAFLPLLIGTGGLILTS
ncbi:membrane protein [Vibrio campbellii]|nr:membrane protein [Vibrio campbellii]